MIPVTPRDRKAAAHYFILAGEDDAAAAVLRGERDDYALVQTMAGHRDGWQDIATAPKDGTWFVTANFNATDPEYEIARYLQQVWHDFEAVGDGLFRKRETIVSEWHASNWLRATHWMPLPEAPETGK